MRRAITITAALAALAVPAGSAQAQSGCPDCVDPAQAVRQACYFVAEKMGWHCVGSRSSASSSACIQVYIIGPGCLLDQVPKP